MAFYTYIVACGRNGTLYIGSTDDLAKRVREHPEKVRPGFTAKYNISRLVWYERHETREAVFLRERQMKKWNRDWKLSLIEMDNPDWEDRIAELA
jgi:putative endonuclease